MRLQLLTETKRADFVRTSFENNDKLRTTSTWLSIFGIIALALFGILLIMAFSADNEFVKFSYLGEALASAVVGIAILSFASPMLDRKADALDYQLMAAFPDWQELLKETAGESAQQTTTSEQG